MCIELLNSVDSSWCGKLCSTSQEICIKFIFCLVCCCYKAVDCIHILQDSLNLTTSFILSILLLYSINMVSTLFIYDCCPSDSETTLCKCTMCIHVERWYNHNHRYTQQTMCLFCVIFRAIIDHIGGYELKGVFLSSNEYTGINHVNNVSHGG